MNNFAKFNSICLIFDLDGTLVDTAPDLVKSLNVVMQHLGLPIVPMEIAEGLIGGGARMLIEQGLRYHHSLQNGYDVMHAPERAPTRETLETQYDIPALVKLFIEDYATHIASESKPYEGCIETLEQLKAGGAVLGVCTNKSERLAFQLLKELKIDTLFDAIICGDTLPVSKPDPRPLRAAIARCATRAGDYAGKARNAFLIGDSITDLKTAANAGVPFIGVDFGYSVPPLIELNPRCIISHYRELPSTIASIILEDSGAKRAAKAVG